ncbi:hypothetical protein EYF80_046808 [Liparis tanakae]|uniref:Uncharacterized protein n=1 Tax=Liparis tanakae TaxID=230148 RepID=A0A4Z2FPN4_9TELE|nr:hypothetical protein EYF80_046808 [Liparis tanakae]
MNRPYLAFQAGTRLIFTLLRTHHHLGHARKGVRTEAVPRSLAQVKEYLSGVIVPSTPRDGTSHKLEGNALNWLQTGLQVLEEHYEEILEETRAGLCRMREVDHQEAWEVAVKWMEKKYRGRDEESLVRAEEDMAKLGLAVKRHTRKTRITISAQIDIKARTLDWTRILSEACSEVGILPTP